MTVILSVVVVLAVLYVIAGLIVRKLENRFIFFPDYQGRLSGDWQPADLSPEDIWLRTSDSLKLHAWWIPAKHAEFTFLAFHGSAGNIAKWTDIYRFLHAVPVNILAVDYRGYGKSEGLPSENGIYLDALAAHDHLTGARNIQPARIIGFGQSLGSPVVVDLATKRQLGGIVLEAPFPSAKSLVRKLYPLLSWFQPFARTKFNVAEKIGLVGAPILIIHFTHDHGVPFVLGQEVFNRAQEPKILLAINGEGHMRAAVLAPETYREKLLEFFEIVRHCPSE